MCIDNNKFLEYDKKKMDTLTLKITTIQVRGTVLQYSYFSLISWFPLKTVHLFGIFLEFSSPQPYTKLKLWKNSGYTRPTLFVGWGEGLDLCELENAPETQKCPRLLSMIVAYKMTLTITSLQFDNMQLYTPLQLHFLQLEREPFPNSCFCPDSCTSLLVPDPFPKFLALSPNSCHI